MKPYKVYPKSVSSTRSWWECYLEQSGYNDLPKKYRYLLCTEKNGPILTIICPHTDFEDQCFIDEVTK